MNLKHKAEIVKIKCKKCNMTICQYEPQEQHNAPALGGGIFKCQRCKRVLAFKNYTDQMIRRDAKDGNFYL